MSQVEIALRKDALIASIKLGLHLQGIEFAKPVTKRLSIEDLEARQKWLRERYKTRCKK